MADSQGIAVPVSLIRKSLLKWSMNKFQLSRATAEKCVDAYVAAIPKWDAPIKSRSVFYYGKPEAGR